MVKTERKETNEKCPECLRDNRTSFLVRIAEKYNPFPEEDNDVYQVVKDRCGQCSYTLVIVDDLNGGRKLPYREDLLGRQRTKNIGERPKDAVEFFCK